MEITDQVHAIVGLPLKSGEEVMGVLALLCVDATRQFDPEQVSLLERFASLASLAICLPFTVVSKDNRNLACSCLIYRWLAKLRKKGQTKLYPHNSHDVELCQLLFVLGRGIRAPP